MFFYKTYFGYFVALLLCISSAHAGDLIIEQAFWDDKSAVADLAQASQATFTPYSGILNRGYTSSATWLRLRIGSQTSSPNDHHIVLHVSPNYLDDVELFDPLDFRDEPRRVGDRVPHQFQEYKSLLYGFVLPITQVDRDVYLKVKSTGAHVIKVEAYSESAGQVKEQIHLTYVLFCIGLILVILGISLTNWLWFSDYLNTLFVVRTVIYFTIFCIYFGIFRFFIDNSNAPILDHAFSLVNLLATWVGCYFEIEILSQYGLKSWAKKIKYVIRLCFVLPMLGYFLGFAMQALLLNALLLLFSAIVFLLIVMAGLERNSEKNRNHLYGFHRYYFIIYYGLFLSVHPLINQWIRPYIGQKLEISVPSYVMLTSLFMVFWVLFRTFNARNYQSQLVLNLALTTERLANESIRREEHSKLLSLLMHEVRNPLTVIELAQEKENAGNEVLVRKNIAIIRSVLERTLHFEKVIEDQLLLEPTWFLFSDCLAQALDDVGADDNRVKLIHVPDIHIQTDYHSLHVILINLLGNAIKYSPPDDLVEFEVIEATLPARLEFVVSNDIGLCGEPDADRVFEKYYRGEGAKKISGTGVGLYLVKQLSWRMGGSCSYRVDRKKIQFKVDLPVN